ncbi:molybdenum ABC transporter ATP-binding protein [Saccharicrinis sp. FJH2]|uniref:molybdenum ABC transporter ATP-binding protein n=1 Tax=Saccharicrinis sp. FJH65 TaxID=3344659 RepID=UPI0035F3F78B
MIDVNIKLKRNKFDVVINEQFGEGISGIYGPSGSGKTSLLQCISGLAVPEEGEISIRGNTVFNSSKKINVPVEKRNIGYVFQEGRLFPHMTVERNLLYGLKRHTKTSPGFDDVVDMLNLKHLLKSKPSDISGGERQRTALGRSLLSSPDILLLDEPFSAVDTRLRNQILPFLLRIHQKIRIPVLIVSHDLPDLLKLTNDLCLIRDGRCIGHDDYHKLLEQKETHHIFSSGSVMNAITMNVNQVKRDEGLTILSSPNRKANIRILCERSNGHYAPKQELKIFINSEDIALSKHFLKDVTIQNQIRGTITNIIERDSSTLCIVDAAFPLVVEITAESLKRMKIEVGCQVWCLFKSVAIDVAI